MSRVCLLIMMRVWERVRLQVTSCMACLEGCECVCIPVPTSWSVFCFHCAVDTVRIDWQEIESFLKKIQILKKQHIGESLGHIIKVQGARIDVTFFLL